MSAYIKKPNFLISIGAVIGYIRFFWRILFYSLLVFCVIMPDVYGAEMPDWYDVVLAVDFSDSMNDTDPGSAGIEALKLMIDLLPLNISQVCIIAYSDEILYESGMTQLDTQEDRERLKSAFGSIDREGQADIWLPLKRGNTLLERRDDPTVKSVFIMLESGLSHIEDIESEGIKEAEYPLFFLRMSGQEDGGAAFDTISKGTANKNLHLYAFDDTDKLSPLLIQIYADLTGGNNYGLTSGSEGASALSITNPCVKEAILVTIPGGKVELIGTEQQDSGKIELIQEESYTLARIYSPEKGEWTIQAPDATYSEVIMFYQAAIAVSCEKTEANPGEYKIDVLLTGGGQDLSKEQVLKEFEVFAYVKPPEKDTWSEYEVHGLSLNFIAEKPGDYQYYAIARGLGGKIISETGMFTATGALIPVGSKQPFSTDDDITRQKRTDESNENPGAMNNSAYIRFVVVILFTVGSSSALFAYRFRKNKGKLQIVIENIEAIIEYKETLLSSMPNSFTIGEIILQAVSEEADILFTVPFFGERINVSNNSEILFIRNEVVLPPKFTLTDGDSVVAQFTEFEATIVYISHEASKEGRLF